MVKSLDSIVTLDGSMYHVSCSTNACRVYTIVLTTTIDLVLFKTKTFTGTISHLVVVTEDSVILFQMSGVLYVYDWM